MTREEAIEIFKDWDGYFIGHSSDDVYEALDMAIKALEQEPTTKNDLGVDCISRFEVTEIINAEWDKDSMLDRVDALPSVTPQEPIIDKIRAEIDEHIEQLKKLKSFHNGSYGASINLVIDTMHKCQKIEQILDDCDHEAWEVLEKIKEVVEDGKGEQNT